MFVCALVYAACDCRAWIGAILSFLNINISQGSAATGFRYKVFNDHFIANLLLSERQFWKKTINTWTYDR